MQLSPCLLRNAFSETALCLTSLLPPLKDEAWAVLLRLSLALEVRAKTSAKDMRSYFRDLGHAAHEHELEKSDPDSEELKQA